MPKILTFAGLSKSVTTATQSLSTTATNLTNLVLTVPSAGIYEFKAYVFTTVSGAPTTTTITVAPTAGPTLTWAAYSITKYTAAAAVVTQNFVAWNGVGNTAQTSTTTAAVSGAFRCSAAGTIQLQGSFTGGVAPTQVVQIGSYTTLTQIG